MGLAGGDVLAVEVPVEIDGGVDLLHDRVGAGRETAAPHLVAHDTPFGNAEVLLPMTDQPHPSLDEHRRRRWVAAAVLLALGGAVAGAVYGIGSAGRNPDAAACGPAVELAQRIAPLVRGEVAALAVAEKPLRLPDLAFSDEAGRAHSLADWQGRFVLFNLWATWCVPCRK